MTQPELAHAHFTHRLTVETDADDVGSALVDGTADFVLLDARSPAAYAAAHLQGAVSLPHRGITQETLDALADGPIVVYCWGPGCNAATKAGGEDRRARPRGQGDDRRLRVLRARGLPGRGRGRRRHFKDRVAS